MFLMIFQPVSGAVPAAARHGQPEGHRHQAQVGQEHPEDHAVHEDGLRRQVRQGREGPQGGQAIRGGSAKVLRLRGGQGELLQGPIWTT